MPECQQGNCIAPEVMQEIGALKARQEATHEWVRDIDKKMDRLLAVAHMGQGSFKTLLVTGTVIASIAGAGAWLWDHLSSSFK